MLTMSNKFRYFLIISIFFTLKTNCLHIKDKKTNTLGETNYPCPNAEDILPCTCIVEESGTMEMDCTDILSEAQLRSVFNQEFPENNFRKFHINRKSNLESLHVGVFGEATFEEIRLEYVRSLTFIDPNVFDSMKQQLQSLILDSCGLESFHFEMNDYNSLTTVFLYDNNILEFYLKSKAVTHLNLYSNRVNVDNFDVFLPSVTHFDLEKNDFTTIPDLSSFSNLIELNIKNNDIQAIHAGELCYSEQLMTVDISWNEVALVEENSICLHSNSLVLLGDNTIYTIDEAKFLRIVEEVAPLGLDLSGNPLECGCDIAWLFDNNNYIDKISTFTFCYGGPYIHEYNAASFESCNFLVL